MQPRIVLLSEAAAGGLFREILPWTLLGIGILLVGVIVMVALRKMIQHDGGSDAQPFTLKSLRDLHAEGKITTEELEKAKAAMIGSVAAKARSEKAGSSEPGKRAAASDSAGQRGERGSSSGPRSNREEQSENNVDREVNDREDRRRN